MQRRKPSIGRLLSKSLCFDHPSLAVSSVSVRFFPSLQMTFANAAIQSTWDSPVIPATSSTANLTCVMITCS